MHRDGWMLGSYILADTDLFKDLVGHGLSCFEQGAGAPTLQLSCYNSRGLQFHCLLWMERRISWKIQIFCGCGHQVSYIFSIFTGFEDFGNSEKKPIERTDSSAGIPGKVTELFRSLDDGKKVESHLAHAPDMTSKLLYMKLQHEEWHIRVFRSFLQLLLLDLAQG